MKHEYWTINIMNFNKYTFDYNIHSTLVTLFKCYSDYIDVWWSDDIMIYDLYTFKLVLLC